MHAGDPRQQDCLLTLRQTQQDEILVILRQNSKCKACQLILNVKMGATLSYYRHYVYFKCCVINLTPFPATYNIDIYNKGRCIWELDEEKFPPPLAIYKEADNDSPSPRQFNR